MNATGKHSFLQVSSHEICSTLISLHLGPNLQELNDAQVTWISKLPKSKQKLVYFMFLNT